MRILHIGFHFGKKMEATYRELIEETSISKEDVTLHHLMDFKILLALMLC
jgi:hypothetical protein